MSPLWPPQKWTDEELARAIRPRCTVDDRCWEVGCPECDFALPDPLDPLPDPFYRGANDAS